MPGNQTPPDTSTTQALEADHFVPSTPENVSWGWFPIDKEPVLRMQSGETVRVNTLTSAGAAQDEEPVAYLTGLGIPREEILQDVLDFWASREGRAREGRGGHVITGPIHVEGAEPGDVLEIEILSVETRVPWGINSTSARGSVFSTSYPGFREGDPALDIPPESSRWPTGMWACRSTRSGPGPATRTKTGLSSSAPTRAGARTAGTAEIHPRR